MASTIAMPSAFVPSSTIAASNPRNSASQRFGRSPASSAAAGACASSSQRRHSPAVTPAARSAAGTVYSATCASTATSTPTYRFWRSARCWPAPDTMRMETHNPPT